MLNYVQFCDCSLRLGKDQRRQGAGSFSACFMDAIVKLSLATCDDRCKRDIYPQRNNLLL